jgi:DNA primase
LYIPEEIINQIRERANIVDIVGEYVPLKKAGQNFKALCPFHSEKTPSFIVSPNKGIFHCFGCGAGGNAFNFIMQFKGLSFPESVKFLGEKVGVQVRSSREEQGKSDKAGLLREIISDAEQLYGKNLFSPAGKRALDYLGERKINLETIKTFHLGFAIDSWENGFTYLRKKGYSPELIEESGLIVRRKGDRGWYDRFRKRIMFPIHDNLSRSIGFGGRLLEEAESSESPKYINTNENSIFHKGRQLYGFNFAEESIRKSDHVFVVEGYIDVIKMYEAGYGNTVAPLGTALTEEQVALIMRYTRNIYLIFDPDRAGVKAALRSTMILHRRGTDPSIIRLPSGFDPGNFFNTYTIEDFELLKRDAITGIEFIIKNYTGTKKEYTANEKIVILKSLSEYYENMDDEIFKEEFIDSLSKSLGTESGILKREIISFSHRRDFAYRKTLPSERKNKGLNTELYLLTLILSNPELFPIAESRLDESYFHGKWTKILWKAIIKVQGDRSWDSSTVFTHLNNEDFIKYLSGKLIEGHLGNKPKEQLIDTIAALKELRLKEKLSHVNELLKKAELENDESLENELLVEKNAFSNELKKIELLRASKINL